MKCERIQELLLTDHMDGELSDALRRQVNEHVRSCAACGEFARAAARISASPLKAAGKEEPPSYIWHRVKERIASHEGSRAGIMQDIAEFIRRVLAPLMRIPRPAIVFAAAAMVIIAIFVARPILRDRAADAYLNEQMSFMAGLGTEESNGSDNGNFFDYYGV